jgi:hypothetical protein
MNVRARLRCLTTLACLFVLAGELRAQCLQGFSYIAPISIVNSSATALSNFQVKLSINTADLITAGKMNADGSDMRFIDGTDCCAPINYFIESGLNSTSTVVWVKVPDLPANSSKTISIVYGNPTASSLSTADGVFEINDQFDGTDLDPSKWTVNGLGSGTVTVGGGVLTFNTSGANRTVRSVAAIQAPAVVEAMITSATGNWPSIAQLQVGSWNGYTLFYNGSTYYLAETVSSSGHYSSYTDFIGSPGIPPAGIWKLTWVSTGQINAEFPGGSGSYFNSLYGVGNVNIALGPLDGGGGATMSVDWVRARRYANPEPVASAPGTEGTLAPPSITGQPVSQTVCSGSTVTFSVSGTGSNFQWRKNGRAIPGATSASYTIPSVAVTDTGAYDVMITANCSPTVTSSPATLTVNTPPHITLDPVGALGCPGQAITFTTAATGTSVTFQWRKNGLDIPGATSTSYTIASTTPADAGTYDVVATGICGTPVTSLPATVGVNVPPMVTDQPQDTAVCREQQFTLSVAATGTGIQFQWRHNGKEIPGATGPTYTRVAQPYDSGSYDVVVSGTCDPSVVTSVAHVGVTSEPIIAEQPLTRQASLGQSITFKVKVDGGGNVTYQWQKDGVNIPGATLPFYTIPLVTLKDIGDYSVVISGTSCNQFQTVVVSDAATLLVDAPPEITKQPENATLCANGAVSFTVGVAGTNLTYQWRKNGTAIPGANGRVYKINSVATTDAGSYDVVITGPSNQTLTSSPAVLTVNGLASITTQPSNLTVCAGQPANFSVAATGTGLVYQWSKNGTALPAATSANYSIAAAATADSGNYSVTVIGTCGDTVASTTATLVVNPATAVTMDPVRVDVAHGQPASFTVVASGSSLTYQWYKDGVAIPGATSATLEIPAVNEGMEGFYYAVVGGDCATDTSKGAKLNVDGLLSAPGGVTGSDGAKLTVIPQPAHGMTRLQIELPRGVRAEGMQVGLYDGAGRRVLDLSGSYHQSGNTGAEFDASQLASGLYICRVESGTYSGTLGVVMVTK